MKQIASLIGAALLAPASAFSFAHLWKVQEVYTNADGSVQFVEFFTSVGSSETSLSGTTLKLDINLVTLNTLPFTANLSGSTLNKTVLIGTSNLGTLYGVTPDYVLPANFLSAGALNSVVFSASGDRVNLTNLPTNGVSSLDGLVNNSGTTAAATAVNSQATPQNFAGQTATIPEPATAGLVVLAGVLGGMVFGRRRRA